MDLFRDIISSVMKTKKDLSSEEDFEKVYNPYVVNRALSFHTDCVLQANVMNQYPSLPKKLQYQYYINTLRGYTRPFKPWQKLETIEDLEAIKEYYNYSNDKAKDALKLLKAEQIEEIKARIDRGGIKKK